MSTHSSAFSTWRLHHFRSGSSQGFFQRPQNPWLHMEVLGGFPHDYGNPQLQRRIQQLQKFVRSGMIQCWQRCPILFDWIIKKRVKVWSCSGSHFTPFKNVFYISSDMWRLLHQTSVETPQTSLGVGSDSERASGLEKRHSFAEFAMENDQVLEVKKRTKWNGHL